MRLYNDIRNHDTSTDLGNLPLHPGSIAFAIIET